MHSGKIPSTQYGVAFFISRKICATYTHTRNCVGNLLDARVHWAKSSRDLEWIYCRYVGWIFALPTLLQFSRVVFTQCSWALLAVFVLRVTLPANLVFFFARLFLCLKNELINNKTKSTDAKVSWQCSQHKKNCLAAGIFCSLFYFLPLFCCFLGWPLDDIAARAALEDQSSLCSHCLVLLFLLLFVPYYFYAADVSTNWGIENQ